MEPAGRDHDLVDLAVELSNNDRADFQMADRLGPWLRQRHEQPAQMWIETAQALCLQSIGEGAGDQLFRQGVRRWTPCRLAPERSQLNDVQRRDAIDFDVEVFDSRLGNWP